MALAKSRLSDHGKNPKTKKKLTIFSLQMIPFMKDSLKLLWLPGCVLLLCLATSVKAQFVPVEQLYIDQCGIGSEQPTFFCDYEVDLDGDGYNDILRSCGWLRNEGNGTFSERYTWDNSYQLEYPIPGDMDLDGDIDLVGTVGGLLYILRNDGQGNFSAVAVPFTNVSLQGLGDVDGDGDLDIFLQSTAIFGTSFLSWVRNEGGEFVEEIETELSPHPTIRLRILDIDDDGDDDIVLQQDYTTTIYQSDNGNFSVYAYLEDTESNLLIADIDGDLDLDVLTFGIFNSLYYFNDGQGSFSNTGELGLSLGFDDEMLFGEFSGEGLVDFVVYTQDEYRLYVNQAGQSYQLQNVISAQLVSSDMVYAFRSSSDEQHKVLVQSASGITTLRNLLFDDAVDKAHCNRNSAILNMQAMDIDEDSDPDLLLSFERTGIAVYDNRTEGLHYSCPSDWHCQKMHAADTDNDGELEYIMVDIKPFGGLGFYSLSSENEFELDQEYGFSSSISTGFICEDLNLDGWLDVVVWNDDVPKVLWNDGTGSFAAPETLLEYPSQNAALFDWNGDGAKDLVFGGTTDVPVGALLIALSGGTFEASDMQLAYGPELHEITFQDVTSDGLPELLSIGGSPGVLQIFDIERADNNLVLRQEYTSLQYPSVGTKVNVYDFEGDSDLDILVGNTILTNNGDGTYMQEQFVSSQVDCQMISDFNQDGFSDIVVWIEGEVIRFEYGADTPLRVDEPKHLKFTVSPNPVDQYCQVELANPIQVPLLIQVFDLSGQLLRSQHFHDQSEIDCSDLAAGIYLVQLSSPELGTECQKVYVTH